MSKHSVFLVDKKRDILYFNNMARPFMPFMLGAKETGSVNIRSIALPFYSFTCWLESEKNAKILCQLLPQLENLEKLMLVRVPIDSQHKNNGYPLKFFDHRSKDTLQLDPIPPPLFTLSPGPFFPFYAIPLFAEGDPKIFGFYQKIVQGEWNNFLAKHPFMKPLEKVVLVFVKAKMTGPLRVSSDKLMLMKYKEREGLGN
jgi:hypothetical protein